MTKNLESTRAMRTARLPRDRVASTYQKIAPVHDFFAHLFEKSARRRLIDIAAIRNGEDVLEVAVGTGLNFVRLVDLNPQGSNVGVDITPAMLNRASERIRQKGANKRHFRLEIGDAYDLSFSDASFDVVLNSYMFDLLPEEDFMQVLNEFRRVLREGGRAVIANMTIGPRRIHGLWETVYRVYPPLLGGCRGVVLEPYASAAGLRVVERTFVSQWTFPTEILLCVKS